MSVKIIVDSTVNLEPALQERVGVVPLCVRFGDREYQDGVTITAETFYEMLASSQELPTTSQPTPAAFEDEYCKAVEAGHEVVCITIASKLSGTYQSATIAAEEFPGKVFVVDSRTAAIGTGILTACAQQMADQGMSGRQILEELMELRKKVRLLLFVDTLEYLKKGGRLSPTIAVVGGLLNIKPMLTVDASGEIKMLGTARGIKKAYAALSQEAVKNGGPDYTKPYMTAYTGSSDENLVKYMEENTDLWAPDTHKAIVGATIGVHVGPGAVAVAFFSKE